MNRLSLCQLTVETGPPPGDSMVANMLRLISAAAGAGFAAVVPRVRQPPGLGAASRNDDRPLHVEEVRRRLADTGMRVASVMSFWMTPETVPAQFEASLDAAAGIGAQSIQVVCRDPDPGRSLANFSRTCAMARSRGLRVALEFMPYSSVRSLSEASAFLLRAGQKNAGLCVDALHFHRSGSSLGELQALDPAALVLVQFCDAPRAAPSADRLRDEARSGRLYPGQGGERNRAQNHGSGDHRAKPETPARAHAAHRPSRRRTLSLTGGCVEKRPRSIPPESGCTMNIWLAAGLVSSGIWPE